MTTFEAEEYNKCWYVEFGYCVFTPKDGGLLERQLNADPSNATLIEAYTSQISLQKHYTCTDPTARYVASLYWAIMTITSIGYGDIAAVAGNTMEQAVCTFLMLLGGMIWGCTSPRATARSAAPRHRTPLPAWAAWMCGRALLWASAAPPPPSLALARPPL